MQKRGQITVFLVVGIVVLLLAALLFFVISKSQISMLEVEEEETKAFNWVKPALQLYIEDCIKETADPSVYLLAVQGGIIYPDEDSKILLTDYGIVNYAWINGMNGLSKQKMQKDLAEYLVENIDLCLDFETFEKQGLQIVPDYDKMKAEFAIQEKMISITFNFPLKVSLPTGDEINLEAYSVQMNSNFGEMLSAVENLNMPNIDLNDLIDLPYQPVVFPYDESVTVYSLSSDDAQEPLAFMFAVRNDYPDNEAPILDFIPDKTFSVGDRWEEVLTASDANNDLLAFSSNSNKFPIAEDGTISLELAAAGAFEVTFSVEDGRGGESSQKVLVTVLGK